MGPGLTPSGDDFIGGLMIGLCAVGYYGLVAETWECLKLNFFNKSNDISSAHVNAAAAGMAANHLHEIVDVLCSGGVLTGELINALESMGHTSGWDALAGLVIALEEWLESKYLRSEPMVA